MAILNLNDGSLKIKDTIMISKETEYNDIVNLVPKNKTWDIKNGYKWIYFQDIEIEKAQFDIGVCYKNNRLYEIKLDFTIKEQYDLGFRSSDSFEDYRLKYKSAYENWLTNFIGEKRNFIWGKLAVIYDPKSEMIWINIKYK